MKKTADPNRRRRLKKSTTLLVVFLACCVLFQVQGASTEAAESSAAPTTDVSAISAPRPEGISVVGHWTLEVRNPDGTTAGVYEFHNAYVGNGNRIVNYMTRSFTPGLWDIAVQTNLCDVAGSPVHCYLHEAASSVTESNFFKTLTITSGSSTFTLSGSFDAAYTGSVTRVYCGQGQCANSTPPDSCTANGAASFTDTTLGTPVPVTAGQQVLVTVDFSFGAI